MKTAFPGDSPEVVYPMFEEDFGGPPASHPLQLHVYRVSPTRAAALTELWHLSPLNPSTMIRWNYESFAAEHNNRFYGVAVWALTKPNGRPTLRLHRLAMSRLYPTG